MGWLTSGLTAIGGVVGSVVPIAGTALGASGGAALGAALEKSGVADKLIADAKAKGKAFIDGIGNKDNTTMIDTYTWWEWKKGNQEVPKGRTSVSYMKTRMTWDNMNVLGRSLDYYAKAALYERNKDLAKDLDPNSSAFYEAAIKREDYVSPTGFAPQTDAVSSILGDGKSNNMLYIAGAILVIIVFYFFKKK